MGLSNCTRFLAYSVVNETTASAAPMDSRVTATAPQSVKWARSSAEIGNVARGATRSSVAVPNGFVRSMPGCPDGLTSFASTMARWSSSPFRVASSKCVAAVASLTNGFVPVRVAPPGSRMPSASIQVGSSYRPTPNTASPTAILGSHSPFTSSLALRLIAVAASAWEMIGKGLKPRPVSSRTTARSTHFKPRPPCVSGTIRASQPRSAACCQSSRGRPPFWVRTTLNGQASVMNRRTCSLSKLCSSEKPKSMSLHAVQHAESRVPGR